MTSNSIGGFRQSIVAGLFASMIFPAMGAASQPTTEKSPAPAPLRWLDGQPPLTSVGVSWGVPWARGTLPKGTSVVVHAADGKSIPTQNWPLAYWPDGSVKWTGLAIAADAQLAGPLSVAVDPSVAPQSSVTVDDKQKFIEISTGRLVCRIARDGTNLIESLAVDGREVGRNGRLIAVREDRSEYESKRLLREEDFTSKVTKVTVEQSGPVRAVIRLEGMHESSDASRKWLPFSVRLYFTAGLDSVRIVHSFIFDGDAQKDFIRGLGIAFTVPFREELQNRHVRFSGDDGMWAEPVLMSPGYREVLVKNAEAMNRDQLVGKRIPNLDELGPKTKTQFESIAVWDSFKLTQLAPDSFAIDKRTGTASSWLHVANGKRARGLAFLGDVSGGLAVGVKHFWEKHPSGLEITGASKAAGELKIWFWSPNAEPMDLRHYDVVGHEGTISYEDHEEGFSTPYGVANTSELTLWALANTPDNATLVNLAKTASQPPLLVCPPEYYHEVPVFGAWSLPDRTTPDKAQMEDQLDRARRFYQREVEQRHWYGFWDFGDFMRTYDPRRHTWMYDIGGHAWNNTELMSDAWLWYDFLRTGRADSFRLAEAITRNTSEVDVYHLGPFAGIGSRHNVSHWGCGAKELRVSEAFLKRFYYYITADERTGDLMHEVITADESLPNALPLRRRSGRPEVPVFIRSGPDWIALASDWMTEWERTGDPKYRDYVLAGMKSIGAMPDAFASRLGFGFDLKTKKLYDVGDPNLPTYEFLILFGGDQIAYELMQNFDCPEFNQAWNRVLGSWARKEPLANYTGSRSAAYIANLEHDPELGHKAWQALWRSLKVKGHDRFPAESTIFNSPDIPRAVEENGTDTPGTAQWALSIIVTSELARDYYVPPTPAK